MNIRDITSIDLLNKQRLLNFLKDTFKAVNGGIAHGVAPRQNNLPVRCENIDATKVLISDSGTANTEFSVLHNLNRVPLGLHIVRQNLAASIYDSGTTWTKTHIFLKCSVDHVTLTLEIF